MLVLIRLRGLTPASFFLTCDLYVLTHHQHLRKGLKGREKGGVHFSPLGVVIEIDAMNLNQMRMNTKEQITEAMICIIIGLFLFHIVTHLNCCVNVRKRDSGGCIRTHINVCNIDTMETFNLTTINTK